MQPAFPFVDISTPVDLLSTMITPGQPGGACPRFQDGEDVHHYALRRHPGALLTRTLSRQGAMQRLRSIAAVVAGFGFMASTVMVGHHLVASRCSFRAGSRPHGPGRCRRRCRSLSLSSTSRPACWRRSSVVGSRPASVALAPFPHAVGAGGVTAMLSCLGARPGADAAHPGWYPSAIGLVGVVGVCSAGSCVRPRQRRHGPVVA